MGRKLENVRYSTEIKFKYNHIFYLTIILLALDFYEALVNSSCFSKNKLVFVFSFKIGSKNEE